MKLWNDDLRFCRKCKQSCELQGEYVAAPEALEYRETQNISPDDLVTLERDLVEMGVVFEDAEDE